MKTAILFTGFIRGFSLYGSRLYENLFKAFPNADLYFCSWDTIDLRNETKIDPNLFYELGSCKGVKLLEWNTFKDKIPQTIKQNRENDIFNVNKFAIKEGIAASNRIKNQWFLVNQAKELIPKDEYDTIVRTRFDLNYTQFQLDKPKKGITIPYNFFSNHYAKDMDIYSGFCDHVAYGDSECMFKYLSMYEHMHDMYINKNANIAHAEGLLKYYLTEYCNINVNMNNKILYQIVKNEHDIDNTPMRQYELHEDNITSREFIRPGLSN